MWRVPNDLNLNGDAEELTMTVTYDTQKLYGKVSEARKITIRKQADPAMHKPDAQASVCADAPG